jgi:hypothetical protein
MQAGAIRSVANVHARALADSLETLQLLDAGFVVGGFIST